MATLLTDHENRSITGLTGFYNWDVSNNLVFGDRNFAAIYGLSVEAVSVGVPVETILSLVAEQDRAPLARYIHSVLLGEPPRPVRYTITQMNGQIQSACSVGSVILGPDGLPNCYAGAVMCPPSDALFPSDSLPSLIHQAIKIAKDEGREITQRYLSSALGSIADRLA